MTNLSLMGLIMAAFVASRVADVFTTWGALHYPGTRESNPLTVAFLDRFGSPVGLILKSLIYVLGAVVLWRLAPTWSPWLISLWAGLGFWAAVNNWKLWRKKRALYGPW